MFSKKLAAVAFLAAGMSLAAAGMAVAQPANTVGCIHLSKQVSDALDAHASSDNYKAARDEQSVGQRACLDGRYSVGISHYSKALEMLGVTASD